MTSKKDAVVNAARELFKTVEDQNCCVVIGSASVLSPEDLLKALKELDKEILNKDHQENMMIDREMDEQMMDEGGGSQARKPDEGK